jgi:hypothetical protein
MLYLRQDFYNIIFKIKHKFYITSGSATPPAKNSGCAPGYRVSCPGVKLPESDIDHTFQFIVEVKEKVDLYLYSLSERTWSRLKFYLPRLVGGQYSSSLRKRNAFYAAPGTV